jgi:protein pelota
MRNKKIVKVHYDAKTKAAKIRIESVEDVIVLKQFISPGSIAISETLRSKEIIRDGKKVKVGKEKIKVAIAVEKVELKDNALRVLGKIVEASKEAKGYHSLELKPGSFVIIQKDWKNWEIEKLRKFSKPAEKILVCVMDEREADIFIVGDRIEEIAKVYRSGGKDFKEADSLKAKYFSDIFSAMKNWEGNIIICGPGFAKDEFAKFLKEKIDESKIFVDSVAHVGIVGLHELLKRKTIEKVVKTSRISEETAIVEKFFEEIAKDGLVAYGEEETRKALETGAVEILLVSLRYLEKYQELLDYAEKLRARIFIISNNHPAGEKFLHFCGIGAFLRFRIE